MNSLKQQHLELRQAEIQSGETNSATQLYEYVRFETSSDSLYGPIGSHMSHIPII